MSDFRADVSSAEGRERTYKRKWPLEGRMASAQEALAADFKGQGRVRICMAVSAMLSGLSMLS